MQHVPGEERAGLRVLVASPRYLFGMKCLAMRIRGSGASVPPWHSRWTEADDRLLESPFFAGGLEGLKALLLVESPLAFRRRQIFVSRDALSRPRDPGGA